MNILIKNMLDCLIGAMAYWSFGWGLAYGPGGNGFTGGSQFFSTGGMEASDYPSWFFQVQYRVELVVWQLGWVDLDLECSTILLGQ